MRSLLLIAGLLWGAFGSNAATTPVTSVSPVGRTIRPFALPSTTGRTVGLSDLDSARGAIVIFTCDHCPFAKLYGDRLNALHRKYEPRGVPVFAINAMDTSVYAEETMEEMQQLARAQHYRFPYLRDAEQTVGKDFGADHTPMAYVIWKENGAWVIRYSGAIDDNGAEPKKATPYVANAVDALLSGAPVALTETRSFGCAIYYRP